MCVCVCVYVLVGWLDGWYGALVVGVIDVKVNEFDRKRNVIHWRKVDFTTYSKFLILPT